MINRKIKLIKIKVNAWIENRKLLQTSSIKRYVLNTLSHIRNFYSKLIKETGKLGRVCKNSSLEVEAVHLQNNQ